MKQRRLASRCALMTAFALVSVTAISTSGQAPAAAGQTAAATKSAKTWTLPRTPWGDPDLQGIWPGRDMMGVPFERPVELGTRQLLTDEELSRRQEQVQRQAEADREEFVAERPSTARPGDGTGPPSHWGERGKLQRQTSLVVDPPDGRIPRMTPEGQWRSDTLWRTSFGNGPWNNPEDLGPYDRCITRGVLGTMFPVGYNAGNQIVQAPGYVALRQEMIHETRIIALDGRSHVGTRIRQYMGDSRGHWDGNTLVVETTNFTNKVGARANGNNDPMSDALRLVERFTRVDADTIQYEVTIDDPKTWTRPWSVAFSLKRDPNYGMFEYACHEGNYGLRNILSGARAQEARESR